MISEKSKQRKTKQIYEKQKDLAKNCDFLRFIRFNILENNLMQKWNLVPFSEKNLN